MTVEERLVHDHGLTRIPEFAVWMLSDGTMVNGSKEGYQRDVDHHEIGEYYKKSKFEDIGSSAVYVRKFMNRGNIRISCSENGYCIETRKTPTAAQFKTLSEIMNEARTYRINTYVDYHPCRTKTKATTWQGYVRHLKRYTNLLQHEER